MRFDSKILFVAFVLFLSLGTGEAAAPESEVFAPHFASVRRDRAFLREGPSYAHRILWVYRRSNYPVRILATYDAWRRVKDVDGTTGWMHHTQLSDRRSIVFIGAARTSVRRDADPKSKIVAYAMPGVVAFLKACEPDFCEVEATGTDGWVDRRNIWGVDPGEVFQ